MIHNTTRDNPNALNKQRLVKDFAQRAVRFHDVHAQMSGVSSTFGYFTSHPVAPLNRKRLGLLLEAIQTRAGELGRPLRVLDLACGGGLITCAIASLGHAALGLDYSADEIGLASLFATETQSTAQFEQANLLDDPDWEAKAQTALGGPPDVIVLGYALHHFLAVDAFVARLGAWLPAESCLLINEENPRSAIWRLKHLVRTWIQHDTDVEYHRTYEAWKALLDRCGFTTAPPVGADMIPGMARLSPARCWSLVFVARKRG